MRKLFSVLLCFLMVAMLIPTTAFGTDEYTIEFSIDKTNVKPGDTVHVTAKASIEGLERISISFRSLSGNSNSSSPVTLEKVSDELYEGELIISSNHINGLYKGCWISWNGDIEDPSMMMESKTNLARMQFVVSDASEDNNPPIIKNVYIEPNTDGTKVFTPGDTVKIYAEIEEESELTNTQLDIERSIDDKRSWSYQLKPSNQESIYYANIPVTSKDRNGVYIISDIYVHDQVDNYDHFSTYEIKDDLSEIQKFQYTISGAAEDIDGPVLESLTADKTQLDEVGVITFTANVKDESEVSSVNISFLSQDGSNTYISPAFYRKNDNTFEAKYYFDGALPTGEYRTYFVELTDEYENFTAVKSYDFSFENNVTRTSQVSFDSGNGSEENPYVISTKEQLNEVRYHLTSCFRLANDIIFSNADFNETGAFYNDGLGWIPIGTRDKRIFSEAIYEPLEKCFSGQFDGNGYSINGLKIMAQVGCLGLFGYTNGAQIQNLTMKEPYINGGSSVGSIVGYAWLTKITNCANDGDITGISRVGGIVGDMHGGELVNCVNKGDISADDPSTGEIWPYAGGIAGHTHWDIIIKNCHNYGNIESIDGNAYAGGIIGCHDCEGYVGTGIIERCANYGNVIGNSFAGGIAGELDFQVDDNKTVRECFNKGEILCQNGYAGGITGCNLDADIIDCYNAGSISASGSFKAGGIVGHDGFPDVDLDYKGRIVNCYNVGYITTGTDEKAGVLGLRKQSEISNCYYLDTATTAVGTGVSDVSAVKCTSDDMKKKATFKNLDFDNTWKYINEYDYPVLMWQNGTERPDKPIIPDGPALGGGTAPIIQSPTIESDDGSKVTMNTDGSKATITVADGYELIDVSVNGVSKGAVTEITGLKTGDIVVVKTKAITSFPSLEEVKEKMATINADNFFARSKIVKMKSGQQAIKLTWNIDSDVDFDGVDIFRSTKRNKGYGTKPIYSTTKDTYYNTSIKKGNTYYYKVRGFVTIEGEKVYTGWSSKAWRTIN